ncbi:hypothetical protein RYX36_004551 [Vicia faba]
MEIQSTPGKDLKNVNPRRKKHPSTYMDLDAEKQKNQSQLMKVLLIISLASITDSQNISFLDAARSVGYAKDENDLSSVFLIKGTYSAFVESHIVQGPILKDEAMCILMHGKHGSMTITRMF